MNSETGKLVNLVCGASCAHLVQQQKNICRSSCGTNSELVTSRL